MKLNKTVDKTIIKRLLFTVAMLIIFCIGSNIPVPGINKTVLQQIFSKNTGLFDLFDLFTGGSFQNFTVFALGVTPYITASIIIQLFGISFKYFENLSKEGDAGQKKLMKITRYLAIALALIQAIGLSFGLFKQAISDQSVKSFVLIILILVTGSAFLIWLGDQINVYGMGNGMSFLIFAGIVARIPTDVRTFVAQVTGKSISYTVAVIAVIAVILIIAAIVFVQKGERRLVVHYAKTNAMGAYVPARTSFIPIKVNSAGVIPIIFAISLIQLPVTISYFVPDSKFAEVINKYLSLSESPGVWIYISLNIVLIIAFTYFYSFVVFKPDEIAKNLGNAGGMIPNVRQGTDTENYLRMVMRRLCLPSAIFLAIVATLPTVVSAFTNINITFGGTSVLILVSVAVDLVDRIKNSKVQSKYHGFGY